MTTFKPIACLTLLLLGLVSVIPGCVVAPPGEGYPREGYYDRDHHRWYHDHEWRECHEDDEHCGGD